MKRLCPRSLQKSPKQIKLVIYERPRSFLKVSNIAILGIVLLTFQLFSLRCVLLQLIFILKNLAVASARGGYVTKVGHQ